MIVTAFAVKIVSHYVVECWTVYFCVWRNVFSQSSQNKLSTRRGRFETFDWILRWRFQSLISIPEDPKNWNSQFAMSLQWKIRAHHVMCTLHVGQCNRTIWGKAHFWKNIYYNNIYTFNRFQRRIACSIRERIFRLDTITRLAAFVKELLDRKTHFAARWKVVASSRTSSSDTPSW